MYAAATHEGSWGIEAAASPTVVAYIMVNALMGLVVSGLLRYAGAIVKIFSGAASSLLIMTATALSAGGSVPAVLPFMTTNVFAASVGAPEERAHRVLIVALQAVHLHHSSDAAGCRKLLTRLVMRYGVCCCCLEYGPGASIFAT